eukprot:2826027-Pyramimonas_sp.AAC.1
MTLPVAPAVVQPCAVRLPLPPSSATSAPCPAPATRGPRGALPAPFFERMRFPPRRSNYPSATLPRSWSP